jgi:hypothetical protein
MKSGLIDRRLLGVLALSALLFFLREATPAALSGADCQPAPPRVRVSVVVILASERDGEVDRRLKCIADEVRKMYPKLKGFRFDKISYRSLPVGAQDSFELIEGRSATISVQCAGKKDGRVRLKVAPPAMGEITYSTPCGKFLPIVTPYRTRDNDLILIAVRVQPCKGK